MTAATIVMAYYENAKMLRLQLHEWRHFRETDKIALSAVIVDDGSPRNPAAPVIKEHGDVGFPIKLFRIKENKPWNQDGARNLAMKHASGWTLMTDMDHMLTRDQAGGLLQCVTHEARQGSYYMPYRVDFAGAPEHPHANSYVMHTDDFWAQGGYDEDFAGAYGSDGNFRKCMRAGLHEKATKEFLLRRWSRNEISDASTNDWGRKFSPYHRSNFVVLEAKCRGPAYKATDHFRYNWEQVI
jgi:hypothetical protein